MNAPFEASRAVVEVSGKITNNILEGTRKCLFSALKWAGDEINCLSTSKLLNETELAKKLTRSANALSNAGTRSANAMSKAIRSTHNAFCLTRESLNLAEQTVHKALLENTAISSIVGESFAEVIITSDINPSFRLDGRDVTPVEMADLFRASGLSHATLCIPGLLRDETMWCTCGTPQPYTETISNTGSFPLLVRFNMGAHISSNGRCLIELMDKFLSQPGLQDLHLDVLTYSQGGLIFRSALYQGKKTNALFPNRIRRALLISSPDGGSYLEKIGYWIGYTLERFPLLPIVQLIGYVGNQRSFAIRDLSYGIIRQEDWRQYTSPPFHIDRLYFGELDDIDATQVYSIIAEADDRVTAHLGDGIVELRSLKLLSDKVYHQKSSPENRAHCLYGKSHFQILHAKEVNDLLHAMLTS